MLPDLTKEIAWWQDQMKPSDPTFGVGLADWTITCEYVPNLSTAVHGPVWGVTCSPTLLPEIAWLTPEDVAAKRAHVMIRTPSTPAEVAEVHETIPHELVHVLDARKAGTIEDMENSAHSLAPLLAEFRKRAPERAGMLARALVNPALARAYRAGESEMPDPADEKKKNEKEPPKAAETASGGEPDGGAVADILAKQDGAAALAWLAKLAGKAVDAALPGGEAAAPVPTPEAQTMGMKPEDAYARGKAEGQKEAVQAIVEANPHLTKEQAALARKQSTAAATRELVATYPRPAAQLDKPTMGALGHPSTAAGGGQALTVRARAMQADPEVLARVRRGTSDEDTLGLHLDVPGHILAFSPSELLKEQFGAFKRAQKGATT